MGQVEIGRRHRRKHTCICSTSQPKQDYAQRRDQPECSCPGGKSLPLIKAYPRGKAGVNGGGKHAVPPRGGLTGAGGSATITDSDPAEYLAVHTKKVDEAIMANHLSALKRARQTERRTARNRANTSTLRSQLRELRVTIEKGD